MSEKAARPARTFKVVRLESENIKRLKAVAIEPSGNVIEITGKNGAGKSSLLDSLFWALSGTSVIQSSPIRKGEEKAKITLDLGALTIVRRFSAKEDGTYSTSLVVESEEGARYQTPQSILDALVGSLTMDPFEFTRMKPKDQFDALRRFVPDFDFDATTRANQDDFRERTEVNRRAKEATAAANSIAVPDCTPDEPIDESALVQELQTAGETNADIERRRAARETLRNSIGGRKADIARMQQEIADLQERIQQINDRIAADNNWIGEQEKRLENAGELPAAVDTSKIRERIDDARRVNADVARKKRRAELLAAAAAAQAESTALTYRMNARDEAKTAAIAAAKMPVEGIGFGDGIVTLNGFPFDQASTAEQIRASIGLAMAANPRLRIVLVREGSLLDEDAMRVLTDEADKHDIQVWIETVSSGRPGAVVIEDGAVKTAAIAAE